MHPQLMHACSRPDRRPCAGNRLNHHHHNNDHNDHSDQNDQNDQNNNRKHATQRGGLAVAEHRLIPSRVRSIGHLLRKAGHQSVWSPCLSGSGCWWSCWSRGGQLVLLLYQPLLPISFGNSLGQIEFCESLSLLVKGECFISLLLVGIRGRRRILRCCSSLMSSCKLFFLRLRWCALVSLCSLLVILMLILL